MGRAGVLAIRHLRYLRLRHLGDGTELLGTTAIPTSTAAIFAPYGHDDLAAYAGPSPFGRRHRSGAPSAYSSFCGDDSREVAGLPIDQIQQAMQRMRRRRPLWTIFADALSSAAQDDTSGARVRPDGLVTAPERLAVMQQRIGASESRGLS